MKWHNLKTLLTLWAAACLLAGCTAPTTLTPLSTLQPPTQPAPQPSLTAAPASPTPVPLAGETKITMDGRDTDWQPYPLLFNQNISAATLAVTQIKAFSNDRYFYLLIKVSGSLPAIAEVDVSLTTGGQARSFWFDPNDPNSQGSFMEGGKPASAQLLQSARMDTIEMRQPLAALGSPDSIQVMAVILLEMGTKNKYGLEPKTALEVTRTRQIEPKDSQATGRGSVCSTSKSPLPPGSFPPAGFKIDQPGYQTEWFVAPGVFNMPSQVFITASGEYLVRSARTDSVLRISREGKVSPFASGVGGSMGAVDAAGNLYLYSSPSGTIERIKPTGIANLVVKSSQIATACSSGFGLGPDGNFYIAHQPCGGKVTLIQVTPEGKISRVAESYPAMLGFRLSRDGRFIGGGADGTVYEISIKDYSFKPLFKVNLRYGLAEEGLAVDATGNYYLSSGSRTEGGQVYKVSPDGKATLLANIPGNGLSGIEWDAQTNEVVGVQLMTGGMIAVGLDGNLRTIIPGNGLNSPMALSFSPCGELLIVNDDGGNLSIASADGKVSLLTPFVSFTPPIPYTAAAPDGVIYASEGAPGFTHRLIFIPPGANGKELVKLTTPSGVVRRADGSLLVAETNIGQVTQVNLDGSSRVLFKGLKYPQALAMDLQGNLYVTIGGSPISAALPAPFVADEIVRISPDGKVTSIAKSNGIGQIAISPAGELFAVRMGGEISRFAQDATSTLFVPISWRGDVLRQPLGMAFDLAGNLYISDAVINGIMRISGFPQGKINGQVQDTQDKPVPNVQLRAWRELPALAGGLAQPDSSGKFSLAAAPGRYDLAAFCGGVEVARQKDVSVEAGREITITLRIENNGGCT